MTPASSRGRRRRLGPCLLVVLLGGALAWTSSGSAADERRYAIALANLTEEPGVTLEGTGFTGREIRESFTLAARRLPVEMVFYDNQRDGQRALTNAEDAVARKVDLFIEYFPDPAVNAMVAQRLKAAGIPIIAISYPVPGAPLYAPDNAAAGRLAGEALAEFAQRTWGGRAEAVVLGPVAAPPDRLADRARAVEEALRQRLPGVRISRLDTHGNPQQVAGMLGRFATAHPSAKLLIAALDDQTALAAKVALESMGRAADAVIVGHGVDRSLHGGASERKELDPNNRGSIVLGSVAFYLDRYGYEVLPLALRLLQGQAIPPLTTTPHRVLTSATIWTEYPPYDMQ